MGLFRSPRDPWKGTPFAFALARSERFPRAEHRRRGVMKLKLTSLHLQSLEEMDNVFGSGEGKADAERMYRIQTELLAANKLDILEDPSTRSAKVQNPEKRDLV